ncbi:AMP-binding protein [Micromonospora sp. NPDC049301]|uniref:AMP-binding protein n=1 Tax=Micromonospora sp. NPDC049301 TaxID=3155723 RepID=UPI00344A45BE
MYCFLGSMLERNVRESGERIALSDLSRSWTYRSLGAFVGYLVEELKSVGLSPGEPVGIAGPRDARLLALMYGVLGCGNPVLAVNPDWSKSDRARRLRAVGARLVLRTEALDADRFLAVNADEPDEVDIMIVHVDVDDVMYSAKGESGLWGWQPNSDDVAYFSFTSGSSGEPKAVAVAQRNAAHYATRLAQRLDFNAHNPPSFAHMTTLAADLGHTTWMLALATGGRVHVVSDRVVRDPYALWRELGEHQVTCLKITPSHLAALLPGRPAGTAALDTVIIGGELLSRTLASSVLEQGVARRVVNHYGPTETTVGAACFVASVATDLPQNEASVPIGTPIGENTFRLEAAAALAGRSDRSIGELVVGGAGVALGYVGIQPAGESGFRAVGDDHEYHTGDNCRRRPDGNLVFLGRSDRQTKVNGYRVDLAEVEQVLAQCPGVARAVVFGRTVDGQVRLVAAVALAREGAADDTLATIPERMSRELPRYAIPTPVIPLPEFPVDPNGKRDDRKLLAMIEQWLDGESSEAPPYPTHPGSPATPLAQDLADFWGTSLGIKKIGPDSDIVALGGDSILAMRTVVFLKERGHDVMVTDVYDQLTAARLAEVAVRRTGGPKKAPHRTDSSARSGALGPAQHWFFSTLPGGTVHWNQVMLLACEPAIEIASLGAALSAVLRRHEALRRGVSAKGVLDNEYPTLGTLAVTWSSVGDDLSAAETIARTSAEINRSLDPASGRLLRCHVFRGGPGAPDRLLLVCHHLVIDTVSWRILLDDLIRSYEAAIQGTKIALSESRSYYDWAAASGMRIARPAARYKVSAHGATFMWMATPAVTSLILAEFGAGRRLEALTVASIARALQTTTGSTRTRVTIETHGRDQGEHSNAYLDSVGWFTAVKQVQVNSLGDDIDRNIAEVEENAAGAPVLRFDLADAEAAITVNYLGQFRPPLGRNVKWTFGEEYCGPARPPHHDPISPMVLTARLVNDRLVVDLVCTEEMRAGGVAKRAFASFANEIQRAARVNEAAPPIQESPQTTSGIPAYAGGMAPLGQARSIVRETPRVLVTGATGFLGSHILDHLVKQGAQAVCLVRRSNGRSASERLATTDQVRVVEGDLTEAAFLQELTARGVLDGVGSVINAAADVRLVAPPDQLAKVNVRGVGNLLDLIRRSRPGTALHHVSTLAVAGFHDNGVQRFSEADFDLNQRFMSPYEASKFEAEKLIRQASDSGTRCFVYRTNHIAAHSQTGAFQDNIGDNRVYQTLKGYILAGCAPRSPHSTFGFSYVDTVAAGICQIALANDTPPDVYHVETPHCVAHDEVIEWMQALGYRLRLADRGEFIDALGRFKGTDAKSADTSRAWEHRPMRSVVFDNARTVSLLQRLGVQFAAPTRSWLQAALEWAVGSEFLPAPVSTPTTRGMAS